MVPWAEQTLHLHLTPLSAQRAGDDKGGWIATQEPGYFSIYQGLHSICSPARLLLFSLICNTANFLFTKRYQSFAMKATVIFTFSKESVLNRELHSLKKCEIRYMQMKYYLLN